MTPVQIIRAHIFPGCDQLDSLAESIVTALDTRGFQIVPKQSHAAMKAALEAVLDDAWEHEREPLHSVGSAAIDQARAALKGFSQEDAA